MARADDQNPVGAGSLFSALEFALGALRSNQDVLLHKVPRTEVVREQLATNLTAIGVVKDALKEAGVSVN